MIGPLFTTQPSRDLSAPCEGDFIQPLFKRSYAKIILACRSHQGFGADESPECCGPLGVMQFAQIVTLTPGVF